MLNHAVIILHTSGQVVARVFSAYPDLLMGKYEQMVLEDLFAAGIQAYALADLEHGVWKLVSGRGQNKSDLQVLTRYINISLGEYAMNINTKKDENPAVEMAMPLPSGDALTVYNYVFTDPDNFPDPVELRKVYYDELLAHDRVDKDNMVLRRFIEATYPAIYGKVIHMLQKELWPLRHSPDTLWKYISDYPVRYGGEKRNPDRSPDPIRQSLQNLKDWIYYWTNDLYALMRPELLRQVNELKHTLSRSVKAQRRTTPRSEVATHGPALKTPDVELFHEELDGAPLWKVYASVYTKGGLVKHTFADFFDTEQQARRSLLLREARTLTPEEYLAKFSEYEVVDAD